MLIYYGFCIASAAGSQVSDPASNDSPSESEWLAVHKEMYQPGTFEIDNIVKLSKRLAWLAKIEESPKSVPILKASAPIEYASYLEYGESIGAKVENYDSDTTLTTNIWKLSQTNRIGCSEKDSATLLGIVNELQDGTAIKRVAKALLATRKQLCWDRHIKSILAMSLILGWEDIDLVGQVVSFMDKWSLRSIELEIDRLDQIPAYDKLQWDLIHFITTTHQIRFQDIDVTDKQALARKFLEIYEDEVNAPSRKICQTTQIQMNNFLEFLKLFRDYVANAKESGWIVPWLFKFKLSCLVTHVEPDELLLKLTRSMDDDIWTRSFNEPIIDWK